ncbi:glyoxylase-like metal-dependent hydrolase (beta-lactamase superfamily II) [Stackebrandtia albiflava]|uniref:Glyoxylase-like metal-dependent hydrolase (Beta-lactamase superfamily II) n=1 Tax=Stackebrandtia albiflava TaxID=406432 RepID=A0A562VCV8_9ACTN|nr:glyoxylase-like metal-dependent hydrolase (beta-lactamase superfamily II) [Stackebrandtia albiflava]
MFPLTDGRLTKFSVSTMDNNVYLLGCAVTGTQVLVDAAAEPERILAVTGEAGLTAVVTTHRHWDHIRALPRVVAATSAESLAHPDDADEIPVVTRTVSDGDVVRCGRLTLSVIHLRGHTPGGVALHLADPAGPDRLFTGDSLFPGGVGKTWGPGDFDTLIGDVEAKLFARFGDDTVVHPGHGDDTTLGAERPHLAEWRARGW